MSSIDKLKGPVWDKMLAGDYHLKENVGRSEGIGSGNIGEIVWTVKHGATGDFLGTVKATSWYNARQAARMKWDDIVTVSISEAK